MIQENGGQVAGMSLGRFHELIWDQPESVARIWFSLGILRVFVDKDGESDCLTHDFPRKQDPVSDWETRRFFEVTLIRQERNMFCVYRKTIYE